LTSHPSCVMEKEKATAECASAIPSVGSAAYRPLLEQTTRKGFWVSRSQPAFPIYGQKGSFRYCIHELCNLESHSSVTWPSHLY
jgi:hypothetical protein